MKNKVISITGWYGVGAILSAYALLSLGLIDSPTMPYHLLNLTGAMALAYETINKKDFQPAFLNVVWAVIALVAIFSSLLSL